MLRDSGIALSLAFAFTAAGCGSEKDFNKLDNAALTAFIQCTDQESWEKSPMSEPMPEVEEGMPDVSKMTREETEAQLAKDMAVLQQLLEYAVKRQQENNRRIDESAQACAREQKIDPKTVPSMK